jgi:hypothetical protein
MRIARINPIALYILGGIATLLFVLTLTMPLVNQQPDSITIVTPSPTPQPPAYAPHP